MKKIQIIYFAVLLIVIALAVAFHHYFILVANTEAEFTISWHIYFNLFYWLCWLTFLPAIYFLNKRIRLKSKIVDTLFFYVVLPLLIIVMHQSIAAFVINIVLDYRNFTTLINDRLLASQWVWVDFILYFIIMLGIKSVEYREKNYKQKIQNSRLKSQLLTTQLKALESQVHPHFLFNTLNTLSTFILKKEADEISRMISLLKNYLMVTLNENKNDTITLDEEIKFIDAYLQIVKVRFGDRLSIKKSLYKNSLNILVPSLILQPLVENAVNHAITEVKKEGVIRISSEITDDKLILAVEDNGPGLINKNKKGIGLKITRERLEYMYGTNHQFILEKSILGGLAVEIIIPYKNAVVR